MRSWHILTLIAAWLALVACGERTDSDADADADAVSDTDADTDADADRDAEVDAYTDADPDADSGPDADGEGDVDADLVADGDSPADADRLAPEDSLPAGASCRDSVECAGEAECVSGEYTSAYCAPLCADEGACRDEATGACGTCMDAGEFRFCVYYCGIGGTVAGCGFPASCPGDLACDGAVCR